MGKIDIAVIGGSGFYNLLNKPELIKVETPYGPPSAKLAVGKVGERKVVFLPRHGYDHELPPSQIPYKANLWAFKSLGVERIIAITACGSLQTKMKRGDFVVVDQFVDRTRHRDDTFFQGPLTTHISSAYPYCEQLSKIAYQTGRKLNIGIHQNGTLVIIEGPRFSTKAESEWFTKMDWDIINMTGYPEVTLAKELELCYCAIALVTDYDVGIVTKEKIKPVSMGEITKVFKENNQKAQKLVLEMIRKIPDERSCECGKVLEGARI